MLSAAGFLKQHKGVFTRLSSFTFEGTVRINSSGNGMLFTADGDEVIIKKENTGHAHDNDKVAAELIDYRRGFFYARIVKIIQRNRELYAARLVRKTKNHDYFALLDQPGYEACAERKTPGPGHDDIAMVTLTGKTANNLPACEIVSFFPIMDESHDLERIVQKHCLPGEHGPYRELENIEKTVLKHDTIPRKDYRDLFTITIDGEDAKDFDDAISLVRTEKGWALYVHIADVSAFVRPDTPLDREALKRGTSYYIGNSVIPMLPEMLSNDLCSLRQGQDRLTLTAEMDFDFSGNITGAAFSPGTILVDRRLTYTFADSVLAGPPEQDLYPLLQEMFHLAMILKNKRMKKGRLDLNLPEEKLVFEQGKIHSIVIAPRLKSNMIIEEFMLSANEAVSRRLTEEGVPSLHRVHEKISDQSAASLKQFLARLGIKLKVTGEMGTQLQSAIQSVAGKDYEQVVNLVILKSLMQAYYGVSPLGHFGLGFKDYTHFTSPIRRYPDLVVHRCLKALLAAKEPPYSVTRLEYLGDVSSEKERVAQKAERDMVKLKACRLLVNRVGEVFSGIISGVAGYGFFVTLVDMPIEGLVPMRNLSDDFYTIKDDEYTVVGRRYGRRFTLGDRVDVRLEKVEIDLMRIDFDLA